MRAAYWVALAGILLASGAAAQQAILQGGSWTAGNVPKYSANTYSGQPLVIDSGLPPGSPNVTVVASLPTCSSGTKGLVYVVTDASSPTWGGVLTGSSTTTTIALCNGSAWVAG